MLKPKTAILNAIQGKYSKFKNSLPDNLRLTSERDYAMKRSWRDAGKPKSFEEAKGTMVYPVYHPEIKKEIYHGSSVSDKTGKFYKPKKHKSTYMELEAYKNNPDLAEERKNTKLVSRGRYWKYKEKSERELKNPSKVDKKTEKRLNRGISMSKKAEQKYNNDYR